MHFKRTNMHLNPVNLSQPFAKYLKFIKAIFPKVKVCTMENYIIRLPKKILLYSPIFL